MERTKLSVIEKLAEAKADSQERRLTGAWKGLYYGYIFGFQEAESIILKESLTK